ncbi:hypothetical protein IQ254_30725 [Nodosilinea sp. LEGE 07088]|nr:hypothetical protein [Nodosilinea sp. LEGE 07088]
MAKLSLWLITLQKNRPFTFLDHALRCGDSLLGVTRREQIEFLHLNPDNEAVQLRTVSEIWRPLLAQAIAKRQELESFTVNDIQDLARKEALQAEAEALTSNIKIAADYLIGEALAQAGKTGNQKVEDLGVLSGLVTDALEELDEHQRENKLRQIREKAQRMLNAGKPEGQPPREPFHWALEFPEVFLGEGASQGFSAIVGNPPFQGGLKLFTSLGGDYRNYLVEELAHGARGNRGTADLCSYFFLRAQSILSTNGHLGLIATNTIAQGDTRQIGLDQLVDKGVSIYRAVPSSIWPGTAVLEVAYVWLRVGSWSGDFILNGNISNKITSYLTEAGKVVGKPYKLIQNKSRAFQGSNIVGMGFVLEPQEAQELIERDLKNKDVLFPYLVGQDLNSSPTQTSSRWVINFFDWPLNSDDDDPKKTKGSSCAVDYPDCLKIVEEKVKPKRISLPPTNHFNKGASKYWWRYAGPRVELYETIAHRDRVLTVALVSRTVAFSFAPAKQVFSHKTAVFNFDQYSGFSILQSNFHYHWAWNYSSTMKADLNYSPSDVFETFPFPAITDTLEQIGETYYTHRQTIMQTRQEGLTKTYNHFHDPTCTDPDIQTLRHLHIQMDTAVAAAYGWHDLISPLSLGRGAGGEGLNHDFHATKQGLRFTISEEARREVLDRLLALNHQRYAAEVAQGLHDKKKGKSKSKKAKSKPASATDTSGKYTTQGSLFGDDPATQGELF